MYAEEFILIPLKTYASDEKTAPQSQILYNPLINDKSSQLNYIQRFRERNISRDSPPPLNPTSLIPLTSNNLVPNLHRKRNLSAHTNFSDDGDDEAEKNFESNNSLQQTSSKRIKKTMKKVMEKPLKCFERLWNPFKSYWKLINWKGQTSC